MLIIFAGLPGTGNTTIARELARQLEAVYLRVDSIEQAIRDSGMVAARLNDAGYRVGYAVAEDNLRLGRTLVVDSVNPLGITRDAWMDVAARTKVHAVEVEITCCDIEEHRRRVERRIPDIGGLELPTWQDVLSREYQAWAREHVIVDTARQTVAGCVRIVRSALGQ